MVKALDRAVDGLDYPEGSRKFFADWVIVNVSHKALVFISGSTHTHTHTKKRFNWMVFDFATVRV